MRVLWDNLHGTPSYRTASYGTPSCRKTSYKTSSYEALSRGIMSHRGTSHRRRSHKLSHRDSAGTLRSALSNTTSLLEIRISGQ